MKKLLLILVVLSVLVGCSSTPSTSGGDDQGVLTTLEEKQEVVIWHTLSEYHSEGLQEIVDRFNGENEMVDVVLQQQPLTDFESKVMQAVRNGVGPDMIFTFPTVASRYVADDLIVDFSEYVDHPEIGIENYSSLMSEAVYEEVTQWDGKLYLMPVIKTGEVFYYNKTLYDELGLTVPATWTELENNSRIITAHTGKPAFGFDSEVDGMQMFIMQAGSGYINTDTNTAEINSDIAVAELENFGNLVDEGVYRLVGEDQYFSNPFGSEAVASYIGSSAGYGFVASAVDNKFEMATAPVPQEGPEKYVSSWGSSFLAFKTTPEKALASYEFAKWFIQPEVNAEWAMIYGAVPVMTAAQETAEYATYTDENPVVATLVESLKNIGYLPAVEGSSEVRTALKKATQEVALGVKDAKTALDDAVAETADALKGN